MFFKKLRIEDASAIKCINLPDDFPFEIEASTLPISTVLYAITEMNDLKQFVDFCSSIELPQNNRVIMLYKRNKADGITRKSLFTPFKDGEFPEFEFRAPMLCSLQQDWNAVVLSKVTIDNLQLCRKEEEILN